MSQKIAIAVGSDRPTEMLELVRDGETFLLYDFFLWPGKKSPSERDLTCILRVEGDMIVFDSEWAERIRAINARLSAWDALVDQLHNLGAPRQHTNALIWFSRRHRFPDEITSEQDMRLMLDLIISGKIRVPNLGKKSLQALSNIAEKLPPLAQEGA